MRVLVWWLRDKPFERARIVGAERESKFVTLSVRDFRTGRRAGSVAVVIFITTSLGFLSVPVVIAQNKTTTAMEAPRRDTSFIDTNGTAHVARVIPVPGTISVEAQKMLARVVSDAPETEDIAAQRKGLAMWQAHAGEEFRTIYPANVSTGTIAGVPVKIVTPVATPDAKRNRVLINLHGGAFFLDAGSMTETIPIANLTQTKVVAVMYRLAPEHPFPAAVDDTVAVYKELLKTYESRNIGLYGASAGAVLTAEVTVRLKQLGLPLPAALGAFSAFGDFSKTGDSRAIYGLAGLAGHLDPPGKGGPEADYMGTADPRDPVLSPIFADLHGMPPILLITGGRDMMLSGTTILHRAYLKAGVDARLVVFEALPHGFWNDPSLPESKEAHLFMAEFFDRRLGK
jgi:monoterpene epsilon-lactone hydrolase